MVAMLVGLICNRAAGGDNQDKHVNRKEIVLGFASQYVTPAYLQCSHYFYLEYHSLPCYYIY